MLQEVSVPRNLSQRYAMKDNKPVYYWDSCIFLSWIKNEPRTPAEVAGLKDIAQKINNNEAYLITSALTTAEILESTLTKGQRNKLQDVMKRKNCEEKATTRAVWNLAHEIRDYYKSASPKDQLPTVTLPDAVHLASAILYGADELHTFDEKDRHKSPKRRALIPLSGSVAGKYSLRICKPSTAQLTFDHYKTSFMQNEEKE